jgi:hypothetical protein
MKQDMRVHPTDNSILTVFYGAADGLLAQLTPKSEFLEVTERTLLALTHFNNAGSSLQESGLICNSLLILSKSSKTLVAVIGVKHIRFSQAGILHNSLKAVVDSCMLAIERGNLREASHTKTRPSESLEVT